MTQKIILPIVILLILSACSNEYYVEAYKSEAEIISNDEVQLRHRFTPVEFDDFDLFLEWYTYDNKVINKAPYKLYVVSAPKTPNFLNLEITSIKISSSKSKEYQLNTDDLPVILNNAKQKRDSFTFEPPLDFDFHANEEIQTSINIKITLKNGQIIKKIKHNWKPIKVKHYAPVV